MQFINCLNILKGEEISLNTNEFEIKFEKFIDGQDYENVELALFYLIRLAFTAGWTAAGGVPAPVSEKIIEIK